MANIKFEIELQSLCETPKYLKFSEHIHLFYFQSKDLVDQDVK